MGKKRILILSIHYPLTMAMYMEKALRSFQDVEVVTVGPYTGTWIPWKGGMNIKNDNKPDVVLPFPETVRKVPYPIVEYSVTRAGIDPNFDMVLTIDAGIHWGAKPQVKCPVVHIATDPHVLNYDFPRAYSDFFFNMQKSYMKDGDILLPYAHDEEIHSIDYSQPYTYDGCLVGLQYPNRIKLVNELRNRGYKIYADTGPVLDEYRQINNQSLIGLNWSSAYDVTARVYEIMGMGLLPLINRIPALDDHFKEGVHYLGFSTLSEAIEKFEDARKHYESYLHIAHEAHYEVSTFHTWKHRMRDLLYTVFTEKALKDLGYESDSK